MSVLVLGLAGMASLGVAVARAGAQGETGPHWAEAVLASTAAIAAGILNSIEATPSARRWVTVLLGVGIVVLLCGVSGFSAGHDPTVPGWLQIHEWLESRWLGGSAVGVVCALAAIVLGRVAKRQGSLAGARGARICLLAAAVSLGVLLVAAGHERYLYAAQGGGNGPPPGSGQAIFLSWTLHQDLMATGRLLGNAAWLGLGVLALVLGAMRLAARDA